MQRLIALAGLLVFLVSAGAASQSPLKSVLVPCGERSNPSVIRVIEQNIRQVFRVSSWPEIESFSECCGFACFPLCFRTFYFRILCQ